MLDGIRAIAPVAETKWKEEQMKMNEKTKELSSIGASLAAHCQPCLVFHVDKARKLGIGEERR